MVDYMWASDGTEAINFNSKITGDDGISSVGNIMSIVTTGGLLVEKTGISYSTNAIELRAQIVAPSLSIIGASFAAGLLGLVMLWALRGRKTPKNIFK